MSKAKAELEQIIGIGNPVEESDITRLPYLHAIIKEKRDLAYAPICPTFATSKAKIDVEINGYTIQQGAQIVINEWAIGRNPSIWENPNLFSPERFLGEEIDVKGRHFQLRPFDWKLENGVNPDIHMGQPL